VEDRQEEIQF